jgi:hypothetical protein
MFRKALQHWEGAQSELQAGRYDTAIALAYYACFELALSAHLQDGGPPDRGSQYSHPLIWRTADRWLDDLGRPELVGRLQGLFLNRVDAQYKDLLHAKLECEVILDNARDVLDALSGRLRTLLGVV